LRDDDHDKNESNDGKVVFSCSFRRIYVAYVGIPKTKSLYFGCMKWKYSFIRVSQEAFDVVCYQAAVNNPTANAADWQASFCVKLQIHWISISGKIIF